MPTREMLRRHAELVDRMATTLGVDLEAAAISGQVSVDEISDAVLSCTNCPNPNHCKAFLAHEKPSEQAPEYCRNQELLHSLIP